MAQSHKVLAVRSARVVGLSLLTLVPGQLGGTETYVRELTRALAAHGELEYRVFVPPVATGAGNGLPEEVVTEYRAARTLPQRFAAMAWAGVRQAAAAATARGRGASSTSR